MTELLGSLTLDHLPLTALGSNPDKNYGLFYVR
jgi:hypothetical protein